MTRIYVPSSGPGDWQKHLSDPELHWTQRYSITTLAHCWEGADGFPPEIVRTLSQNPSLANAVPLLIFPEWKVPLPGGTRPARNDVWALAKTHDALVSISVDGKVEESFDKTLADWNAESSSGKNRRLEYLKEVLGLQGPIPGTIRYQLVQRTASAVIEAERFGARHAVMIIHSFSKVNSWLEDFKAFVRLWDLSVEIGRLVTTSARNQLPLHLAWVPGDGRFLKA